MKDLKRVCRCNHHLGFDVDADQPAGKQTWMKNGKIKKYGHPAALNVMFACCEEHCLEGFSVRLPLSSWQASLLWVGGGERNMHEIEWRRQGSALIFFLDSWSHLDRTTFYRHNTRHAHSHTCGFSRMEKNGINGTSKPPPISTTNYIIFHLVSIGDCFLLEWSCLKKLRVDGVLSVVYRGWERIRQYFRWASKIWNGSSERPEWKHR